MEVRGSTAVSDQVFMVHSSCFLLVGRQRCVMGCTIYVLSLLRVCDALRRCSGPTVFSVFSEYAGLDGLGEVPEGVFFSECGFYVQCDEGVQDVESDHRNKPESNDGYGVVIVDMVAVPQMDHLLEPVVLDRPAGVRKCDERPGANSVSA